MRRTLARPLTVEAIVSGLGGLCQGDPLCEVTHLASLGSANPESVSFVVSRRHLEAALQSRAGVLIASAPLIEAFLDHREIGPSPCFIVTDEPYAYYARLSQWFEQRLEEDGVPLGEPLVDPLAVVHPSARLGRQVRVAARAVIGPEVSLGDRCRIGPGTVIGRGSRLGDDSLIHANVTLYHDLRIGHRAIIHSGTVIGADGFGFAPSAKGWIKIAQLGSVVIGDDVEIGAQCAIDRGALDDTVIEDGCKLDNLVQVAHNVRIGAHTAIAGCVGIAGSAVIGRHCMIGGGAGILGHLEICDGVTVSAMSLVTRSITEPGVYTGIFPLASHRQWERTAALVRRLPELRSQFRSRS